MTRQPAEAMSSGFDNDKGIFQLVLGVQRQNSGQFLMNNLDVRRQETQKDDACLEVANEHETAEVFISSNKDPALVMGSAQQIYVGRARATDISRSHHIVTQLRQEARGYRLDILIEQ